jgi:multidrug resistance protein MdtO
MVTRLSTTGVMKQRLTFRLLGAIIGGLVFGLGAIAFLFPHMDSIGSFVALVGFVAFLPSWLAGGPRFNYLGLQIAFAFYLVAVGGFRPPTQLAPARDRSVGILLAFVIMWFVFDQIWPVRTVTVMRRRSLACPHSRMGVSRTTTDRLQASYLPMCSWVYVSQLTTRLGEGYHG